MKETETVEEFEETNLDLTFMNSSSEMKCDVCY